MTAAILGFANGFQRSRYYVTFDGTNDYLSKSGGLDNATDGTGFSCVFWLNTSTWASSRVLTVGGKILIDTSTRTLEVRAYNAAGTEIGAINKSSFFTDGENCYFISWQQGGSWNLYVGDSNLGTSPSTNLSQNIDISNTGTVKIGDIASSAKLNADVYNFWVDDQYIDFSVQANRRKFLTAGGKAEQLGATGSVPTGSTPLIYLNGYDKFTNRGRGGQFTVNGALTQGGAAPI